MYSQKIKYAQKAFGKVVTKSNAKTIIQVMQELEKMKHTDIILVVGSDRVQGFRDLLNKYNGKDYNFDSIQVVSGGERDPDADDVSGMSASKMRALASDNDLDAFKKGLPRTLQRDAEKIMKDVRNGMNIKEDILLWIQNI